MITKERKKQILKKLDNINMNQQQKDSLIEVIELVNKGTKEYEEYLANIDYVYIQAEVAGPIAMAVDNSYSLEYSLDKKEWKSYKSQSTIYCKAGERVYFRGINNQFDNNIKPIEPWDYNVSKFRTRGIPMDYSIGGDVRTLFDYTDVSVIINIPDYCFRNAFGGDYYNRDKYIKSCTLKFNGIKTIGKSAFHSAFSYSNINQIPTFNDVEFVDNNAFYNCFRFVTNDNTIYKSFGNLIRCGEYAFAQCFEQSNIKNINAFNRVKYIGKHAFESCFKLSLIENATIFDSVEFDDNDKYNNDCIYYNIKSATFNNCFAGCSKLKQMPSLPMYSLNIDEAAFKSCFGNCNNMESNNVLIGNTMEIKGNYIPNIIIGHDAFHFCFYNTKIHSASIYGLKEFTGTYGFEECFAKCGNLDTIQLYTNTKEWDTNQFKNWLLNTGNDVTGDKIIIKPVDLDIPNGDSGIPDGWIVKEYYKGPFI